MDRNAHPVTLIAGAKLCEETGPAGEDQTLDKYDQSDG
jgi:hypothetical protein